MINELEFLSLLATPVISLFAAYLSIQLIKSLGQFINFN
ncbi:hypothetical protein PNC201_11630 [Pseudoalteromonas sp. NC201]|uniref:Uncharacterized protein n=1 Tax=Pseudoalteromonas piscicida TaxID=43662 RepID=A0ABM6NDR6_PSEO7|nr:hypothetical protein PPIS_a2020 [Pseudoalteromonas piscicida]ATD07062.1 hypothetical protein PPIS_a2025 [Pseudoalteromonas piscicida]AUJ70598.1 hypothetical protein PNC201_11630 [Pseudoalteromonas sp. NC201]MBE0373540.1 hypothetical protein [Pseudoalteromonas flavipulchra NCIMB 2033 = ATCC BAA-314]